MDAVDRAVTLFDPPDSGIAPVSCAQAVFAAFAERLNVDPAFAIDTARGFSGGIARHGFTCGAVTGAVMALGFAGRDAGSEDAARHRVAGLVSEFIERFRVRHGDTACRELIGVDLRTEEGRRAFRQTYMRRTRCSEFVRTAAEIVDDLLDR